MFWMKLKVWKVLTSKAMSSEASKILIQIAFNLLLIIILLVGLITIVQGLISSKGDLGESLFLLVFVVVGLVIGIGFLARLIRSVRQQ